MNLQLTGFLGDAYPWVKAGHITFVIFWMTTPGSAEDRAWIEREDRVRTIILMPAMLIVWVLGLLLAVHIDAFHQGWFMAKLALVIGLSAYQGWLGVYGKSLAAGKRALENRTLRIMNELPGIAAALIVVLVIVRPF